jgi:hypothetical protein
MAILDPLVGIEIGRGPDGPWRLALFTMVQFSPYAFRGVNHCGPPVNVTVAELTVE